jgi:HK97 family phage major capsid protein
VLPSAIAILAALGLIEPLGHLKDGTPIWPIEGGDGTAASPTIDSALERLRARRSEAITAAEALVGTATTEQRDLTPEEFTAVSARNADVRAIDGQIAELETLQSRSAAAATERERHDRAIGSTVQVTRNEATYRPNGGHSFLRDIYEATKAGNMDAAERLRRNNAEGYDRERRAWQEARNNATAEDLQSGELRDGTTGSTSMGSFIPPVWLVEELAAKPRVGRVLAPFMRSGGFPVTNSITIPRVTTGSSVASQSAENAAVSETDIVTAQLTRSTVTVAGQQDVSMQSLDLSPYPVDRIIFADLDGAYEEELDRQLWRGAGTSGELLGVNAVSSINAVTYTDGSPTVPEFYPKVADGIQQIGNGAKRPAQIIVMTPRRWGWITAALDSQNRPLVTPVAPQNSVALFGEVAAQGIVGGLQGLPVVSTASGATNLGAGTNQDQVMILRPAEMILMEGPKRTRILTEVLSGNLTVRLQLFAYVNFFAGRLPSAISTIDGTGLVTPTF